MQPDETRRHPYSCRCADCRRKYGDLPLLADAADAQPSTSRAAPQPSPYQSVSSREPMRCNHCGKTFTHKGDLNKHTRTHTGEQPFECSVCARRFSHTSNLSRHLRLHSGDRPYVCDVCKKDFSRKDKLDAHKKSKACRK